VSWPEVVIALALVLLGALLQGSIGFGANLVTAPAIVLFEPSFVPGPAIVLSFAVSLIVADRERAEFRMSDLRWGLLGRVPGTVLGVVIVSRISQGDIGLVVGPAVLVAVLLVSLGRGVARTAWTLFAAGVVSSIMGTAAAVGGPAMALVYHDAPGPELRGSMSVYIGVGSVLSIGLLTAVGRFGASELVLVCTLMPAALLGVALSRRSAARVDLGGTRTAVLLVSGLSAMLVLVKTIA